MLVSVGGSQLSAKSAPSPSLGGGARPPLPPSRRSLRYPSFRHPSAHAASAWAKASRLPLAHLPLVLPALACLLLLGSAVRPGSH